MGSSKKHYAVVRGFTPGIYAAWYGTGGAEEQIRGYAGALYRGFASYEEADQWRQKMTTAGVPQPVSRRTAAPEGRNCRKQQPRQEETAPLLSSPIVIYTDGGCRQNPGPGGYGAVIIDGESRRELSQGYRLTTNNRMELMACIAALRALQSPAGVVLHSDSQYVVNGIEKGWAKKWRACGWMRNRNDPAGNADLWAELLALCEKRPIRFVWVRGHAGNRENEICDRLATEAALSGNPQEDCGYTARNQELRSTAP